MPKPRSSVGWAPPTSFSVGQIECPVIGEKFVFTQAQGISLQNLSQRASGTGLANRLAGSAGRDITKAVIQIGSKLLRSPKTAALGVSLVLSALLTAAALRLPDLHWLAWISFLPLFVVVRSLRPPAAALAGGFWGGCLYLFCSAGPTPTVDTAGLVIAPSVWLLALLIVIPAVYVGLAARSARAIGFKLLMLAIGWTLIEAVLHFHNPSAPHEGLLTGSQGDSAHLHWFARLLGYVSTAFLVACANVSLVGILSGTRLRLPARRSLAGSPDAVGWLPSQVVLAIQSWPLRQGYPRAPPAQVDPA